MRGVDFELENELREVMRILERSDLESEAEMFMPPVPTARRGPIFEVACTGCAVGQCVACLSGLCSACAAQGGACRTLVGRAIFEAIRIARAAADKVDAAISVTPTARGPAAKETARLFRFFFCHDPSKVVPWAGGPSGVSVAWRLRAAA